MIKRSWDVKPYTITEIKFSGINEVVKYINEQPLNANFIEKSKYSDNIKFSGTDTYKEAEQYLLNGWEHGVNVLKKQIEGVYLENKSTIRPQYGVQGSFPSIPRYLSGYPDNMIDYRRMRQKQKVITINKVHNYSYKISTNMILKDSEKVLKLVSRLEMSGIRVNLNVLMYAADIKQKNVVIFTIPIKHSGQLLNFKTMSFPLIHPAMLRRIYYALLEHTKEFDNDHMAKTYGWVLKKECYKDIFCAKHGEYVIEQEVEEQEIENIEKYFIK